MTRILVAIDFSSHSVGALTHAARLARASGAEFQALHILPHEDIEDIQELRNISTDHILENARARLDALVSDHVGGYPTETVVRIGHVFDQLVAASEEFKADLVVMGASGESEGSDSTGIVAAKCIRRASSPVLLVRSPAPESFKKITACVDFSPTSALALATAADLARIEKAELEVVHIFYPHWLRPTSVLYDLSQDVTPEERANVRARNLKRLADFLQAQESALRGLDPVPVLLERGNAAHAIAAHLRDTGSQLVVLGTRGRTGMKALLLGTTAERLLHESPCSVLAVKPPKTA